MSISVKFQNICNEIREKLPTTERVAKATAITLVVAAYALTAFASIAFIFSGTVATPFALLGAVSLMVTLANLSTIPNLMERNHMNETTGLYKENIRKFVYEATQGLMLSMTTTMTVISLSMLLNNVAQIAMRNINPIIRPVNPIIYPWCGVR